VSLLDLGEAQLEYRLWPGEGTRGLVLLHEGLGCVSMWRDFPERLRAASGWGVFAFSRRGYGGSSPAPLPWPVSYMHDEARHWLPRVIEASGFEDVVLIGHSDGASIAAIHAAEAPHPKLRGLVLMAPHFFVEDVSLASIARAGAAYEAGELKPRLERHHGANVDNAFWGWNTSWLDPAFRDWDIRALLPHINMPTLLIQGAADEYGTLAQVEAAQGGIAAPLTTLVLPQCRHSPHRDQPEATLAAIVAFLSSLPLRLSRSR
jgi:pimeloyl-ACP methyl ester carboxylesterase